MALKFVDPFSFWTTVPGTFTSQAGCSISAGRLVMSSIGAAAGALISNQISSQPTFITNMRLNVSVLGAVRQLFAHTDGGTNQAGLSILADNKLQFFRTALGTNIGSASSVAIIVDSLVTFYDIETKITINDTTGTIEARVNGGVQITGTGLDTQNTGNAFSTSTQMGRTGGNDGVAYTFNFEHLILMDGTGSAGNDFIGPVDVVALPPTSDGTYTEWAVSAGNRFAAVDDADPNGDTDYISSGTVGQRNTFNHGALAGSYTAVKAAAVWINARRDDATTRAFKVLLRNATPTDNLGGIEHFVGNTYTYFFQPYELNPFTAAAWTTTEINAVQYGVQVTT